MCSIFCVETYEGPKTHLFDLYLGFIFYNGVVCLDAIVILVIYLFVGIAERIRLRNDVLASIILPVNSINYLIGSASIWSNEDSLFSRIGKFRRLCNLS